MKLGDYPGQEPFTAIGAAYHAEVWRRGEAVPSAEFRVGDDAYQGLSVVRAPNPNGTVLIALHGGGWTSGYKEWMLFMAPALTSRGVTFVSAGYRLAPVHTFPAGYDDVLNAIAFVHAHAREWGGDPKRIFLCGHSAGGHLASLAALRDDWQEARGLPRGVIRGALPISGVYVLGAKSGFLIRPRFLGAPEHEADDAASPTNFIRSDAPPFLIAYGERDFAHLIKQADEFASALRSAGVTVDTLVLPDCDHLGASYASGEPEGMWAKSASGWMQERVDAVHGG